MPETPDDAALIEASKRDRNAWRKAQPRPDINSPEFIEAMRQALTYEPETGEIYWTRTGASVSKALSTDGYRKFGFQGRGYSVHRVAWLLHHGS